MSKRASARRKQKQQRNRIIIAVVVVAIVTVGLLIALSDPPTADVAVVADYSGIPQEVVQDGQALGYAIGDPDAPVTLIDYSDFSCPHCYDLAVDGLEPLVEDYVADGKLRIIYKPITFVNPPYSQPAAYAAICAGEQGKFWEMHTQIWTIYDSSGVGAYTQRVFAEQAEALGLDMNAYRSCYANPSTARIAEDVMLEAQALGINGTPSMLLNGQPFPYQGPAATQANLIAEIEALTGE